MPSRKQLIQLAHVGAAALFGRDEDARRDYQYQVSSRGGRNGQRSCSKMTLEQLNDLVTDLREKGALKKRPPKRAGRVPFNRAPYMAKVEAQLAELKVSWQYAESIAWRISGGKGERPGREPGVKKLEWFKGRKNWEGLIAALEVEQKKRYLDRRIDQLAQALGLTPEAFDALIPSTWPSTWRRDLKRLRQMNELLDQRLLEKEDACQ